MLIKNLIVLCLIFVQVSVYSQGFSTSYDTPISILISDGLIINKVSGDLDFGDVLSTGSLQTLTKTPDAGVLFEVNGTPKSKVFVNYSVAVDLNNSIWVGGSGAELGNLTFIPNVEHTKEISSYINPIALVDGKKLTLKEDGGTGIGKLFIWVGGVLEVPADQPIGDYEGTFTVTVAFQ